MFGRSHPETRSHIAHAPSTRSIQSARLGLPERRLEGRLGHGLRVLKLTCRFGPDCDPRATGCPLRNCL
jgi:hypothetical protein